MEPESSSPYSQVPAICPYPEVTPFSLHPLPLVYTAVINVAYFVILAVKGCLFFCLFRDCKSTLNSTDYSDNTISKLYRSNIRRLLNILNKTTSYFFMFCWPCILVYLWVNDQLDAQLRYITVYYYNPLHVSSNSVLIIILPSQPTHRTVTYSECYNRCCINTIWPPDDEHRVTRNM